MERLEQHAGPPLLGPGGRTDGDTDVGHLEALGPRQVGDDRHDLVLTVRAMDEDPHLAVVALQAQLGESPGVDLADAPRCPRHRIDVRVATVAVRLLIRIPEPVPEPGVGIDEDVPDPSHAPDPHTPSGPTPSPGR